jgi:hypothetical protein
MLPTMASDSPPATPVPLEPACDRCNEKVDPFKAIEILPGRLRCAKCWRIPIIARSRRARK